MGRWLARGSSQGEGGGKMVLPDDSSVHQFVDRRHGVTDIGGPLFVGGVSLLAPATNIFTDTHLREHLRTDKRFREYLEFREKAFKIAAEELVAASNSPVDLFLQTDRDEKLFRDSFFKYQSLRDMYIIVDDEGKGRGVDNILMQPSITEDQLKYIRRKNDKDAIWNKYHRIRRYYAYRKSLTKLEFIKWNSDPEEVLKRIKLSTGWSQMDDCDLEFGLKWHMRFLKTQKGEMGLSSASSSISEYEKTIDSELASELEQHLRFPDEWLMNEYFNRMKIRNLARECSNQAQKSGIILVEEFLPVRRHLGEQILPQSSWPLIRQTVKQLEQVLPKKLPLLRQTVTKSLNGCIGYFRGRGAGRIRALCCLLSFSMTMAPEDEHKAAIFIHD